MATEAARPRYSVRNVEVVAKGTDILVREYTLDPGEFIPWHHHTNISDRFFCLEGTVRVQTQRPAAEHKLQAGDSTQVSPGTAHHVSNPTSSVCRFLLVQGVGAYDWIDEEPPLAS